MADEKTYDANLLLVYRPDTYTEEERINGASWPLGSGWYDLFAVADGARIHLNTFKAGAVDKLFAQAKERKESEQQTQQSQQQQAQVTQTQPPPEQTQQVQQTQTGEQPQPPQQ